MRSVLILVAVGACGTEYAPDTATWFADVGPLVRTHCTGCHVAGGIAPFSLVERADVAAHGDEILVAVEGNVMPPFSAEEASDCTPTHGWTDDPRLSLRDKARLRQWIEGGMPDGEPRDLPSPPSTAFTGNLTVAPPAAFHASGDRDQFVCYLFDPQLSRDRWLTGLQVRPEVAELVHHATVTVVPPDQTAAALADFGGIGVAKIGCTSAPGAQVHTWLPGNAPLAMPDGVAVPVAKGALIGVQLHYHPNGVGGDDATAFDLRFVDDAPAWSYVFASDGNAVAAPALLPGPDDPASGPAFVIPAKAAAHREQMITPMSDPGGELRILSFTPHMHFLGTHLRATLTHADGRSECVGNSAWSFDWQRTYTYDAPLDQLPLMEPGNVVEVTCDYDNSFSNPMLPRMLHDAGLVAPIDVTFGEETIDEMCLANLGLVRRVQ